MDDSMAMDVAQARSRFQEYFGLIEHGAITTAETIVDTVRAFRGARTQKQVQFATLLSLVALELLLSSI